MEQEKEKNEETFVKKVVQTALEAERQIRRQQVLHNTRMLMEEYIEMKRHIESAVSEEEELKEEQYDIFRGEGAHLGSVRRSKMKTAMMIANIDRAMEELRAEYETKEMTYKYDAFKMHYMYAYYVQHKIVVADMVHHITEIEEDWTQRLNVENLFPLSNGNHGIISALYKKDEATKRQTQELLRNIIQQHWKGVGGIEKVLTGLD